MATDMQRLVVSLEAKITQFEKALNKATGVANKRAKAIESRFATMNSKIGTSMAGVGKRWIAGLAAGVSVGALAKFSDAATRIDNSLKVAGLSGEELEKVYGRLRDSAIKNAAPIEDLVTLYSRASMAAANLGASQEDLDRFTNNVAVALRVSGKSAGEASGALLQLSQVLGGSVVQAQEFNSLVDGAYPLLQAVASGLEEAGGDVGKLTQLVKAGKVPTKAFFDAFQAGSVVLEQKVAGSTLTISQAFGNLHTSFVDAVRDFEQSTQAGEKFATGIDNLARAVTDFDVSGFVRKISEAGGAIEQFFENIGNSSYAERFAEFLTGAELTVGQPIKIETLEAEKDLANVERQIGILRDLIAENTKLEIDSTEANAQLNALLVKAAALRGIASGAAAHPAGTPGNPNSVAEAAAGATRRAGPPATPAKVKLTDYDLPGDDKDKKSRRNEWERETAQIKERTAAIQAETAAMAGLNPLINDYGFALEKARAVAELENAALAAKVELTPQVRASIDSLATSYANAVVEAEKLAESQDLVRERAEEMRDLGKDVMGGFISDLRSGKSAAEALQGALDRVLDKVIEIGLNSLFDIGGGGGFGGILGGIGKLFGFSEGGYTGVGGKNQPAGVVHKGEVVFSQNDVRRHGGAGAVEAMRLGVRGYANGGVVGVPNVAPPRVATGAPQNIVITLVGEEGEMFTPRVQQISGQTAGVVVRESRPTLARDAVSSVQQASRNRPGIFR